jgi:restriction system protein
MTIPDYQSLMSPVLVASSKGEVRISAVVEELANQLGLSPEERSELLPSGKQTVFSNRVHWAKTYLAQAGLIENTRRGHFEITLRGQQVLASQPSRIDNAFLSRFEEFQQFKERARLSQSAQAD